MLPKAPPIKPPIGPPIAVPRNLPIAPAPADFAALTGSWPKAS